MLLTPKRGGELLVILREERNKEKYGRITFNYYKYQYRLIFKSTDVLKGDLPPRPFSSTGIKALLLFRERLSRILITLAYRRYNSRYKLIGFIIS
jgi:hypothetical protein